MIKLLPICSLITAVFMTTACTVMVRDTMVVSPSSEIVKSNLDHLIDEVGYKPVRIPSEGAILYGLEKTRPGAETTLVVLHGNALNLSIQPWYGLLETLAETDLNVLAIDYRGFGLSTGEASFSNMQIDAGVALEAVPDGQQVILYGLSLGSVAAVGLAGDPAVRGLILEGGITNTDDMITVFRSRKMFGSMVSVEVEDSLRFDIVDALAHLDKPVLVIHGKRDENIPFAFGEVLFSATKHAGSEFYAVAEGGHCDSFRVDGDHFLPRLQRFVTASLDSN